MSLLAGKQKFLSDVINIIQTPSSNYSIVVQQWSNALSDLINSKANPPTPATNIQQVFSSSLQSISEDAETSFINALTAVSALIVTSNPGAVAPTASYLFPKIENPTHQEFANALFDSISLWFGTGTFIPSPGAPPTPWA